MICLLSIRTDLAVALVTLKFSLYCSPSYILNIIVFHQSTHDWNLGQITYRWFHKVCPLLIPRVIFLACCYHFERAEHSFSTYLFPMSNLWPASIIRKVASCCDSHEQCYCLTKFHSKCLHTRKWEMFIFCICSVHSDSGTWYGIPDLLVTTCKKCQMPLSQMPIRQGSQTHLGLWARSRPWGSS